MLKFIRNRKGQGLVEYALIIAGVALICAVGIAVFGHKVSDMISMTAVILPGAHTDDNHPIISGKIIETAPDANGNIALNISGGTDGGVIGHNGQDRLEGNVMGYSQYGAGGSTLVQEAN